MAKFRTRLAAGGEGGRGPDGVGWALEQAAAGLAADRVAAGKAAIRIGIGIATGAMVAGYTGTHQRATYTCIGDTVNLAALLEAHTKVAHRVILIDEATRTGLRARIDADAIGVVRFAGKSAAVDVYAVGPSAPHPAPGA